MVYNIDTSVVRRSKLLKDTAKEQTDVPTTDDTVLLFATKTCPKCKVAQSLLDKAGISYTKLYVEDEEALAKKLGLRQAPTLVVGGQQFTDVAGIKAFLDKTAKVAVE